MNCTQDPSHGVATHVIGWGKRPLARTCERCTNEVQRINRIYKAVTVNGTLVKSDTLTIVPIEDGGEE